MKQLEKEFVSGMSAQNPPLTYKQICRQGMIAVYQRSLENVVRDFEVIIIRLAKAGDEIFSKIYSEDQEFYPGSSLWGKQGFSYHGIGAKEAAIKKFNSLLNEKTEETNPVPEKEMVIPDNEFTTNMLAELNNTNYLKANLFIKSNLGKTIEFVEERRLNSRGKASKFYATIKTK